MMPFSKEQNRRIYIAALTVSFLLIVGSIYLHLRQKTHLGRMSFNLDRDRIQPTSGVDVESSTAMEDDEYDSKFIKEEAEDIEEMDNDLEDDNDIFETSSDTDEYESAANYEEFEIDDDINDEDSYSEAGEDSNAEAKMTSVTKDDVDSDCLRCMCMTINECRTTYCLTGDPCGLFKISKSYWIDSGKPTVTGNSDYVDDQDYLICINDEKCSATVIRQYFRRYKRDCNMDGVIDCRDQIALHFLGPSGCLVHKMSHLHENRMDKCLTEIHFN